MSAAGRPGSRRSRGCWYTLCQAGLAAIADAVRFRYADADRQRDGWCGEGLRLDGRADRAAGPRRPRRRRATALDRCRAGCRRPPPRRARPAAAAVAVAAERGRSPPTLSPLAAGGRDRFKRGLLVHRLLQSLPELPVERARRPRRGAFSRCRRTGSPAEEQDEIRRETLAVLGHPDFARSVGPELAGRGAGRRADRRPTLLSGQIDRLVVDRGPRADRRLQDLAPAARQPRTRCAPIYLRQLATYRAALERIYPGREIGCALLWTDGPRLMPISPERLAGYLP